MRKANMRPSRLDVFAPLEYLNLVGYFTRTISSPSDLVCDLLNQLRLFFGEELSLGKDAGVSWTLSSDRSPTRVEGIEWSYEPELGRYVLLSQHRDVLTVVQSISRQTSTRGSFVSCMAAQTAQRADPTYRLFDHTWKIVIEAADVPSEYDCMILVSLSTHLFRAFDKFSMEPTKLVVGLTNIWLRHGDLHYGFATTNYHQDDRSGWAYEGFNLGCSNIRFSIENELWRQAGVARHGRVRGLYASQYLSPVHLEKLGGKDCFVADLLKVRDRRDDLVTDLGERGIIFRLTASPTDHSRWGSQCGCGGDLGAWAFCRFRDAGLFL